MWVSVTIEVQKASAKNAYCVYGHPSPFAFIGFTHALCQRAGMRQEEGVIAIIHDLQMRAHARYGEYTFDMPRSAQRDVDGKTQIDLPQLDLSASLVFSIDGSDFDGLGERIEEALSSMRFAGGVISEARFRVSHTPDEALRVRAGFVMAAAQVDDREESVFDRMLDKISIQRGKKGWFSPSLMGFRLIEDVQCEREGARGGHPHAYADPLIGIVQFRSASSATLHDRWSLHRRDKVILFKTENPLYAA